VIKALETAAPAISGIFRKSGSDFVQKIGGRMR
jgi:hypothetical protein